MKWMACHRPTHRRPETRLFLVPASFLNGRRYLLGWDFGPGGGEIVKDALHHSRVEDEGGVTSGEGKWEVARGWIGKMVML